MKQNKVKVKKIQIKAKDRIQYCPKKVFKSYFTL